MDNRLKLIDLISKLKALTPNQRRLTLCIAGHCSLPSGEFSPDVGLFASRMVMDPAEVHHLYMQLELIGVARQTSHFITVLDFNRLNELVYENEIVLAA